MAVQNELPPPSTTGQEDDTAVVSSRVDVAPQIVAPGIQATHFEIPAPMQQVIDTARQKFTSLGLSDQEANSMILFSQGIANKSEQAYNVLRVAYQNYEADKEKDPSEQKVQEVMKVYNSDKNVQAEADTLAKLWTKAMGQVFSGKDVLGAAFFTTGKLTLSEGSKGKKGRNAIIAVTLLSLLVASCGADPATATQPALPTAAAENTATPAATATAESISTPNPNIVLFPSSLKEEVGTLKSAAPIANEDPNVIASLAQAIENITQIQAANLSLFGFTVTGDKGSATYMFAADNAGHEYMVWQKNPDGTFGTVDMGSTSQDVVVSPMIPVPEEDGTIAKAIGNASGTFYTILRISPDGKTVTFVSPTNNSSIALSHDVAPNQPASNVQFVALRELRAVGIPVKGADGVWTETDESGNVLYWSPEIKQWTESLMKDGPINLTRQGDNEFNDFTLNFSVFTVNNFEFAKDMQHIISTPGESDYVKIGKKGVSLASQIIFDIFLRINGLTDKTYSSKYNNFATQADRDNLWKDVNAVVQSLNAGGTIDVNGSPWEVRQGADEIWINAADAKKDPDMSLSNGVYMKFMVVNKKAIFVMATEKNDVLGSSFRLAMLSPLQEAITIPGPIPKETRWMDYQSFGRFAQAGTVDGKAVNETISLVP